MNPEVVWTYVINATLGLVVLICCALVARAVLQEVAARFRRRSKAISEAGAYVLAVPGLGTTMADGGRPTAEAQNEKTEPKPSP